MKTTTKQTRKGAVKVIAVLAFMFLGIAGAFAGDRGWQNEQQYHNDYRSDRGYHRVVERRPVYNAYRYNAHRHYCPAPVVRYGRPYNCYR